MRRTERQRDILLKHYGCFDEQEWTYAKIAEGYGASAERIRRIERNAGGAAPERRSAPSFPLLPGISLLAEVWSW